MGANYIRNSNISEASVIITPQGGLAQTQEAPGTQRWIEIMMYIMFNCYTFVCATSMLRAESRIRQNMKRI